MFILGKLFLLLLKPITWIVVLFLLGFLVKKPVRKKRLLLAGFLALVFFSNPFFFRILGRIYEPAPRTLGAGEHYQAGILLGGFVSYNISQKKAYFNPASDRFIQTALLYARHQIDKVIIAAGNGYIQVHTFKEADFARDRLVELGVPATDILTDPYSRNTYENAVNAKKIADSANLHGPYLLISSAMHLPRAGGLFRKQGMDVRYYPCDFITENISNNFWEDYLLPSSIALANWENLIKEITGTLIYKITGKA